MTAVDITSMTDEEHRRQLRRALIASIRAQIDRYVLSAADTSPQAVRQFLESLGDPAAVVDSESERLALQLATSGRLTGLPADAVE